MVFRLLEADAGGLVDDADDDDVDADDNDAGVFCSDHLRNEGFILAKYSLVNEDFFNETTSKLWLDVLVVLVFNDDLESLLVIRSICFDLNDFLKPSIIVFFFVNGLVNFVDEADVGECPFWLVFLANIFDEPLEIRESLLSFVLLEIRTDFEVTIGPTAVVLFDLEPDLVLSRCVAKWAGGWDNVFRNEGFHNEQSSGAEL